MNVKHKLLAVLLMSTIVFVGGGYLLYKLYSSPADTSANGTCAGPTVHVEMGLDGLLQICARVVFVIHNCN